MLTPEQADGIKQSICEDCNLQHLWLANGCPRAEDCHNKLMLLFGVVDKVGDSLLGPGNET